jgi:transposase
MNNVVGIDVAKATLAVCLVTLKGRETSPIPNDPKGFQQLHRWLKKRKASQAHVCLEATGIYGIEVAQFLHDRGYTVSVVNPARIQGFAHSQMRRSKTDQVDAEVIADFCQAVQPQSWTPPPPAWYELRALMRHMEDLQTIQQQETNRLETTSSPLVRAQLQEHIAFIGRQIDQIKRQTRDHLQQHPALKQQTDLLCSIPGIGELTAWRLVAEVRALTAFEDVRQLVAYVGLDPTRHDSGSSVRGSRHISRKGRAELRAALYMPALSAMQHNPIVSAFAQRLKAQGKLPKQVIVAAMRKLLHLAYGVLKSGRPFDPHYGQSSLLAT